MRTKLLYRATEDGWGKFHEKCDRNGSTLIVCKSNFGKIFGGYVETGWNDKNLYYHD